MFKKAIVVFAVILAICSVSFTGAFAQSGNQVIDDSDYGIVQPYWTEISMFSNNFDISTSGLATVESLLYAYDVDEIKIVAKLQQYKNGSWTTIKSWTETSDDIYCAIGETWYVASGYSYRLVSTGTVYENGSQVEQTSYTSPSYYY